MKKLGFFKKNLFAFVAMLFGGLNFAWFALPYIGIGDRTVNGYQLMELMQERNAPGSFIALSVFQICTLVCAAVLAACGVMMFLRLFFFFLPVKLLHLVGTAAAIFYALFALLALIFTIVVINSDDIQFVSGIFSFLGQKGAVIGAGCIVNLVFALLGASTVARFRK